MTARRSFLARARTAGRPAGPARDSAREVLTERSVRDGMAPLLEVLHQVADGDLEARVPVLVGVPAGDELRETVNRVLDLVDAYVRESSATLTAASAGRFHRAFLTRGMVGAFREGAELTNAGRTAMAAAAAELAAQEGTRQLMVDRAIEASTQVAAASTELGASAGVLAEAARSGVAEAERALTVVQALEDSSTQITRAVRLIKGVADQTRLLALNATIEAARAGDAGRGFAVVAAEVKTLADETARSSDDIAAQVEAAHAATDETIAVIGRITEVIAAMDGQVGGVKDALSAEGGLSHLAESLQADISGFAAAH